MEHITPEGLQRMVAEVADAGAYGCFEYQGVSVGLRSDADLLENFTEYFGGYFVVTPNRHPDAAVTSTADPELFQRLKEAATSEGVRRSDEETELAVDARHSIIHRRDVDEAKGKVEEHCVVLSEPGREVLVALPGSFSSRRKTVKRSLRNLMKLQLIEAGWLPFHSAACVLGGTGICILGEKFAGKTSTLVNLLARPGARLVSNDNLFLRDGGGFVQGCGFPNNAGLRLGILAAHPWLVDALEQRPGSYHPQVDPATLRDLLDTIPEADLGGRPEKVVLLATELAHLLGIGIEQVAPIGLFLVVTYDPSLEQSELTPLTDPQEIRRRLAPHVRRLDAEKQDFLQRFFGFDDESLDRAFDGLQATLASGVAVHELRQNARTNEHSAELVESLTRRIHERV
jgi:hypothetical protein